MIVCKICGFDNEPGAQFCGSCGGFLEWTGESTAADPGSGGTTTPTPPPLLPIPPDAGPDTATTGYQATAEAYEPGQVICPSCGLANKPDRVFCQRCAAELVPIATAPLNPTSVSTRRGLPVAGIAIVAAAFAVVLIAVVVFATGILGRKDGQIAASSTPSIASVAPSGQASPSGPPSASASAVVNPPAGPTGKIAFGSSINGNADIVVATADGSTYTRLVEADGNDVQPAWSPDGDRIAWAAKNGIRIANADGTKGIQFTNHGVQDRKPEWSPDGKTIAFASSRDGDFDLFLRPIGTTNLIRLTNTPGADYDPSWSAGQNRIVFVSERAGTTDIWRMKPDGKALVELTGTNGEKDKEDDPAWSPDGKSIAFATDREGTFFIYVMNADGSNPHRLASGTAVEHDPTWSPDGRFIAFARADDPGRIVIVSAEDGTEVGTLGEENASAGFPSWH